MSENLETAKRPTFLTVLCILSFIAAGISIIGLALGSAVKGVAESAGASSDLSNLRGIEGVDSELMNQAEAAFSWPSLIGAIVLTLIALFGVIKMWKLQKQGYYIYVGASVIGLILPLILGSGFSVFSLLITGAFIVMYGLNLKAMR
jgi:hypothetical protein